MFKEPKESLLKEVKENVMTVSYQIENIINTEINYQIHHHNLTKLMIRISLNYTSTQ